MDNKLYGSKIWITGITFILALVPFLDAIGLAASEVLILVGAVLAVIGMVLIWLDK